MRCMVCLHHPSAAEKLPWSEAFLIIGVLACLSWLAVYGIVCAVLAVIGALT